MPSPFPGMNPYLEQEAVWQDFHQSFIFASRAVLMPQVAPRYVVKAEEHIFLHEQSSDLRRLAGRPDLSVAALDRSSAPSPAVAAIEPDSVEIPDIAIDTERHSYLTIRDRQDLDLITVIELLSPSNKTEPDRTVYLDKRKRYLKGGVNLVELDLLRGGPRLPLTGIGSCDYYAMVARRQDQPRGKIWRIQLRDRLPQVPIPLRQEDSDAQLDLQSILNRVYDEAGYENYIYRTAPQPSLRNADQEWAKQFIPVSI